MQREINYKRTIMSILGVAIIGLCVGVLKVANFGVDPATVFFLGIWSHLNISLGLFNILFNLLMLTFVFFIDRSKIGIGTIMNLFFMGYIIDFSWKITSGIFPNPSTILRLVLFVVGIVIMSLGVAIYMTADQGISAYDSIPAILSEKFTKLPYRFWRILTDGLAVIIGFILGEKVGLGTLATAIFLGPLIQFFLHKVAEPLFGKHDY